MKWRNATSPAAPPGRKAAISRTWKRPMSSTALLSGPRALPRVLPKGSGGIRFHPAPPAGLLCAGAGGPACAGRARRRRAGQASGLPPSAPTSLTGTRCLYRVGSGRASTRCPGVITGAVPRAAMPAAPAAPAKRRSSSTATATSATRWTTTWSAGASLACWSEERRDRGHATATGARTMHGS